MSFFKETISESKKENVGSLIMNITLNLPFLNIHNLFTNERISVYLDKHTRTSLDIKNYAVKQNSHLSKSAVIVAIVWCQFLERVGFA